MRRENEIIILLLDKDARNDFSSSYKKMMYSLFHVLSKGRGQKKLIFLVVFYY